jgi:hypothetical protein
MSKAVADQFNDVLVAAGVKRVYGVVGDSLNEQGIFTLLRPHDCDYPQSVCPFCQFSLAAFRGDISTSRSVALQVHGGTFVGVTPSYRTPTLVGIQRQRQGVCHTG